MTLSDDRCYRALVARDPRFDGLFYVGVKTTGIYCRPICPARTPRRDRSVFYKTAAEAERDGFRACLRCRPELAPGAAPVDSLSRLVTLAVSKIHEGALNDIPLEALAESLGVSGRHLRRAMQTELGVSPSELAQAGRTALAKQLLHDTSLPITEVALASGFRSLRRFNEVFRSQYGRSPSALRTRRKSLASATTLKLTLDYRPPYDWPAILRFLELRAAPGVELVRDGVYLRTVCLGEHRGWVAVSPMQKRAALEAEVPLSLASALLPLVARLRRLFDLDAEPRSIAAHLRRDPVLATHVKKRPGLRVPGAFDPFESAVRAVLGQQVSVSAATTLYGRLVAKLGAPIDTPHPELTHLAPLLQDLDGASESALSALGTLPARAATLRALAHELTAQRLRLEPGVDPEGFVQALCALPGVGVWTAQLIAMRGLSWPDAFPEGDLGIRKALGGISPKEARSLAEAWRPWRAYAVMHLWMNLP